jgi:hypothetical protein
MECHRARNRVDLGRPIGTRVVPATTVCSRDMAEPGNVRARLLAAALLVGVVSVGLVSPVSAVPAVRVTQARTDNVNRAVLRVVNEKLPNNAGFPSLWKMDVRCHLPRFVGLNTAFGCSIFEAPPLTPSIHEGSAKVTVSGLKASHPGYSMSFDVSVSMHRYIPPTTTAAPLTDAPVTTNMPSTTAGGSLPVFQVSGTGPAQITLLVTTESGSQLQQHDNVRLPWSGNGPVPKSPIVSYFIDVATLSNAADASIACRVNPGPGVAPITNKTNGPGSSVTCSYFSA